MFSYLIDRYLSTEGFMPHGMCYLWQPGVLTLNIVSDVLITLAYFSIPFALVYFVRKRKDLRFNWIFVAFAIFIVACGFTHLMEIATIWYSRYWLAGGIKAVTAVASVATSILLIRLMPAALRLPSPAALQSAIVKLENEVRERVRVEEELRRLNATLEARVADRTLQLETINGTLIESSIVDLSQRLEIERLRTDFVSTVSHELRTPLTSISGSLGLLQAGAMGVLPEKAAAMIRIAYKNSGRLVRIINDILDIGKLEAGQLTLRMVRLSLAELLGQAIEANAAYAEQYGVRFLLDGGSDDKRVLADPDRLMQVVTNLLSNAAKFSRPGADVLIRVRPGSTTMLLEVEDTGPGIPEAFQGRIFEKFAQADASPTRRFEGTGLGLSIARQLVQAMGGTIGFTTVVGQGTIFHLELPLAGKAHIVPVHNSHEAEGLLRDETLDMVVMDQALPDGEGS
jgi:signal transduction histidine kinase